MTDIPMLRLSDGREIVFYTEEYVLARLQDAGCTLMMIPGTGCWPPGFRGFWPEIVRSFEEAYGYDEAEVRYRATMKQMTDMNEVLGWLMTNAAKLGSRNHARALTMRMLTYPDSGKPRYSWPKIAKMMRMEKRAAERHHDEALRRLTHILNEMDGLE